MEPDPNPVSSRDALHNLADALGEDVVAAPPARGPAGLAYAPGAPEARQARTGDNGDGAPAAAPAPVGVQPSAANRGVSRTPDNQKTMQSRAVVTAAVPVAEPPAGQKAATDPSFG